jgi:hypothetical protein
MEAGFSVEGRVAARSKIEGCDGVFGNSFGARNMGSNCGRREDGTV